MLRRRSKHKPAAVQRHHDRVAALGCLVCGAEAELHHVSDYADRMGRIARDEMLVTPLCAAHHRIDPQGRFPISVQGLTHRGFFAEYGIDLLAEAIRLRDESLALERDAA